MSQIRATPEQLRQRASEYRTEAEKVNEVIGKMDSLLSALQGEYEGAAAQAFAAKFAELRPGFVKAEELINQIAAALTNNAQVIEEADRNNAQSWG